MELLIPLTLLLIIVLTFVIFHLKNDRSVKLPPGPKDMPIFGHSKKMSPRSYLAFDALKKKYGGVITVYIGRKRYILLTSYQTIKEALIGKAENFSGRMKSNFIGSKYGILSVDGAQWQEHRRFSLHALRDFGFGRNHSEEIIHTELERLFTHIESQSNSINTLNLLLRTVSNVICTITMGEQPGYEDEDFSSVVDKIRDNIKSPIFTRPTMMFPRLQNIGKLALIFPSVRRSHRNLNAGHDYIKKKIEKHRQTIDLSGEPRDFVDVYLQQQHKLNEAGGPHTFTEWQLIRVIFELFIAGTDTTSNSLAWGIFWLSYKPELQERVFKEIDEKLGRTRPIQVKDRKETPFLMAVLDEIQRWASIVPNSLLHRNIRKDVIQGYDIPADSIIIPCIYSAHHDPDVWEKPEEFYPQHFLNESGEYRSREELIPFSIGRRSCLGESLARMELYVFFASIIRRYSVSLDPESLKNLDDILLGTDGIIRSPGDHKIIFKVRE